MDIKFLGSDDLNHLISTLKNLLSRKLDTSELLNRVYPVGSIYITINNINPSDIFGGIWESWGSGKTLVGVDTSQAEFSTVEQIGGEKTHTLTSTEMPSHKHTATISEDGAHTHEIGTDKDVAYTSGGACWSVHNSSSGAAYTNGYTTSSGKHSHTATVTNTGGGIAHNNLQPYITCYFWKRTA